MNADDKSTQSRALVVAIAALFVLAALGGWYVHTLHRKIDDAFVSLARADKEAEALRQRVLASEELLATQLQKRLDGALPVFVDRAANDLAKRTLPSIRVQSFSLVNQQGEERIQMGLGTSPYTGNANVFFRLVGPKGGNPVFVHSTDEGASVGVDARAMLSADGKGRAGIAAYRQPYSVGAKPAALLSAAPSTAALVLRDDSDTERVSAITNSSEALLAVRDSKGNPAAATFSKPEGAWVGVTNSAGNIRSGLVALASGQSGTFINNASGETVYAVASTAQPYAESLLKENPASQAWGAASTFSTLKTFWDIFIRR